MTCVDEGPLLAGNEAAGLGQHHPYQLEHQRPQPQQPCMAAHLKTLKIKFAKTAVLDIEFSSSI